MEDMISILKETGLANDIKDVSKGAENELIITLNDNADVAGIVKKVNDIDVRFWKLRAPIKMNYVYEDGRLALL